MTGNLHLREAAESGAFFYIPNVLPNGILLPETVDPVEAALQYTRDHVPISAAAKQYMLDNPDEAFDILMTKMGAVLVIMHEGEVSVLSQNRINKLSPILLDTLKRHFGIWPDTPVGWFASLNSNPSRSVASEVLYGKKLTLAKPSSVMSKPRTKAAIRRYWYGHESANQIVDKLLE